MIDWVTGNTHKFLAICIGLSCFASVKVWSVKPDLDLAEGCVTTKPDPGCWVYPTAYSHIKIKVMKKDLVGSPVTQVEAEIYVNGVLELLTKVAETATGKKMLERIEQANPKGRALMPTVLRDRNVNVLFTRLSKCELTIRDGKAPRWNGIVDGAGAKDQTTASDKTGSDSEVAFHPCRWAVMTGEQDLAINPQTGDVEDRGTAVWKNPLGVVSHELIHSYHHVTGRLDTCKCCEELRTTGLRDDIVTPDLNGISENAIRKEMGKPLRTEYRKCMEKLPCSCSLTN